MPFSIIANIKTQQKVELTSQTPTLAFLAAIATNYGGVPGDYTYYTLTSEEFDRVDDGDEYGLVWEGEKLLGVDFSPEDNKGWLRSVVSISESKVTFNSVDVQKVQIFDKGTSFTQNDLVFKDDAIWRCQEPSATKDPEIGVAWSKEAPGVLLTLTILLADRATIDTSANFTDVIPVGMSNDKFANMKVEFINGVCKKVIVLNSIDNCGNWSFPQDQKHITLNGTSYRVDAVALFSGLLPY